MNDIMINQYISGTGGAKLDTEIADNTFASKSTVKYNFTYIMNVSDSRNGFLKCTNKDNQILVDFINV